MGLFKQANSPIWHMSFSVGKKQLRRSTGTSDEKTAKKIFEGLKAKIALGLWHPEMIEQQRYTFDEMITQFKNNYITKLEETTQGRHIVSIKHLEKFFKGRLLSEVTPELITSYINHRAEQTSRKGEGDKKISLSTINREVSTLSVAFNYAIRPLNWIKVNPCNDIKRADETENKRTRYATTSEEQEILKHATGYLNNDFPDIISLALNTALREANLLSLEWKEIDLFRKIITIPASKSKTNKSLIIPLNQTAYTILIKRSKIRSMSGYIFTTSVGTPISHRNMFRAWESVREKAGVKDLWFHDLRRTAATRLSQMGVDIKHIQDILGHKDISTTIRYINLNPEYLRVSIEKLDNYSEFELKNVAVKG